MRDELRPCEGRFKIVKGVNANVNKTGLSKGSKVMDRNRSLIPSLKIECGTLRSVLSKCQ